ncbi:MAG: winged helix-turn-helix transcriptional regulator [Candidatus Thermoplasmatota archaeon]|jgi:uncharacterized membrane protein/DNA-binding MarR family transcriptional regulator|nr:winged helix-turn-helix transcriptional regulator [Candidatus Thermoplasmatota archaeon]
MIREERKVLFSIAVIMAMGLVLILLFQSSLWSDENINNYAAQPEAPEAGIRSENYSFSISLNETEHVLYLEPGLVKEMELEITNTGEENDSYTVSASPVEEPWPYLISHSRSPSLAPHEDFLIKLNVTAPNDLFLYPREYVFEIKTASVNQTEITNNITLLLILTSIDIDMEIGLRDENGDEVSDMEIDGNRNELLFLSLVNSGNVFDEYEVSISGLSQGWSAYFRTGTQSILVELGPGNVRSSVQELIVVSCNRNSTESSHLVILANSTAPVTGQPISKTITVSLEKRTREIPVILESEIKYLLVDPGEEVEIPVTATNFGSNGIAFKPLVNGSLPQWIKIMDNPATHDVIQGQSSAEYLFKFSIGKDTLANSEHIIGFTGTCREDYGRVFDIWVHLKVRQVFNLTATIDTSSVQLDEGEAEQIVITLHNNGNGEEDVDIYREWNDSLWVNTSYNRVVLAPFETKNATFNISVRDTEKASSDEYSLTLVSSRNTIIFKINITVVKDVPNHLPDLAIKEEESSISYNGHTSNGFAFLNFAVVNLGNDDSGYFTISVRTINKLGSISQTLLNRREDNLAPHDTLYFSIPITPKQADLKVTVELDDGHEVEETNETNNLLTINIYPNNSDSEPNYAVSPEEGFIPSPIYITGGGIIFLVIVLTVIYGLGTESTKYSMLSVFVPLYSKMMREDILSHATREKVYHFVKNHPGEHYRSILESLELKNGTLSYHLKTLEKREFIVSKKDGPYRRFYLHGSPSKQKVYINGLRKKLYDFILKNPGLSQKEIAKMMKCTSPTVNYHVNNMVNQGLVDITRKGRETHCFAINSQNLQQ